MLTNCRSTVDKMWRVAESLQEIGVSKYIPFVAEDSDIRHAMKMEVLFIFFSVIGEVPNNKQVEFLQYVLHAPIAEENKEDYFERVCKIGEEHYFTLLPYFCVIDKYANTELSETYLKFIAALLVACVRYSRAMKMPLLQRYNSIMTRGKWLVRRQLKKEVAFEPLDFWDEGTKVSIEQTSKTEVDEKNGLYNAIMRTLDTEIREKGGNSEFDAYIKSLSPSTFGDPEKNTLTSDDVEIHKDETEEVLTIEEAKIQLERMVGLVDVKWQVLRMINHAKIHQQCKARGINRQPLSYHMVYTGNPGTGKTTVARLMAQIYRSLGILSKGHLVEVGRAELVGEYVGHTAIKVQEVLKKAKGGVLFIDEAYSLVSSGSNDFGREAIATLLKGMEDNRDDLMVIAAGYPELMKKFIDSNPGLASRFSKTIVFPDYGTEELVKIFVKFCDENSIKFSNGVMDRVRDYFDGEVKHKTKNFGNARMVRNFFEEVMINQANRLAQKEEITDNMLRRIVVDDIPQKIYIDKFEVL